MQNQLDHSSRLGFLQIDVTSRAALQEFRPLLLENIDDLLESFYQHIVSTPDAARVFKGRSLDHARKMQRTHWLDNVFSGRFDEAYFTQAMHIGKVHEQVGLEPRWYMGGYCFTLNKMAAIATDAFAKRPGKLVEIIAAVNKAAFLDMDLAISVYIQASKESAALQMSRHADRFETDISSMVGVVASAATELQGSAGSMTHTAELTTEQAAAVTRAAEDAAGNVQTVASATEELSTSIGEISRQVTQSLDVARNAVTEAERTNTIIQGLVQAAAKIGDVVKLINVIARQTNMLALNATIEAARAGDAGKGFAVVAGEVKNLANQTAHATGEISLQVNAVQTATELAVAAIQGIGGTISHISEISAAIAAAVEQQGAATRDIARNISDASRNTSDVTANIEKVTVAAAESGHTAHDVLNAASELSRQSENLSVKIADFLLEVRRRD